MVGVFLMVALAGARTSGGGEESNIIGDNANSTA